MPATVDPQVCLPRKLIRYDDGRCCPCVFVPSVAMKARSSRRRRCNYGTRRLAWMVNVRANPARELHGFSSEAGEHAAPASSSAPLSLFLGLRSTTAHRSRPSGAPSPSDAEVSAEALAHRSEPRFAEQSPRTVGDSPARRLLLDGASVTRLVMAIAAGATRMLLKGFVGRIGGSKVA